MKDIKPKSKKTTGYGFVGVWSDGTLGWWMPKHISNHDNRKYGVMPPHGGCTQKGTKAYLCKITVQLVKSKSNRFICRNVK